MITVCCRFTHYFKIMPRHKPVCFEVFPPLTVQRLISGGGVEGNVWFTRCIKGRKPEIYEPWTFADDVIRKVHMFAQVQISDGFIGETFHTHVCNAKAVQIPLFGRISVNVSVNWLDVPWPFSETGVATAAWTENIYVNPWLIVDSPARIPYGNPINLVAVAHCVRDNLLNIQTLQRENIARCLSDTRDEVLSNDDRLESDWSD